VEEQNKAQTIKLTDLPNW